MNVVVIVLDCLRLDYSNEIWKILSKYGFHKMDFAITTAPWTIPAHASMLTGLYPSEHGAHESKNKKIGSIEFKVKDNNIVNDLKRMGYTTYLFTANAFLTERFGFGDFDYIYFNSNVPDKIFLKPEELKYLTEKTFTGNLLDVVVKIFKDKKLKLLIKGSVVFTYRKFSSILGGWPKEKGISKIIAKIKKTKFKKPYFIFVNLMELHEPYRSEDIKAEYEFQLSYLKEKFEKFIEVLNNKGCLDNLVIVTSDHGQLLGENGRIGHGIFLYDELIKVPFFIKIPEGQVVKSHGYISHANLKRFILKYTNSGEIDTSLLFSDAAFAESFGSYSNKIVDPNFERHMIAVYCKGCKGIYDVERRKFEESTCVEENLRPIIESFLRQIQRKKREMNKKELKIKIKKLKSLKYKLVNNSRQS